MEQELLSRNVDKLLLLAEMKIWTISLNCCYSCLWPAVLRIESGVNSNPKIDTLLRIANAVGKSIKIELVDAA